ncbi:unnamed protein product [Rotaria sordida]|uniref:DNA topoisomerase (ATP-hydrolyzing) n=1 Tax=Rotaria sordida TaxID=392033 RepID=A0A819DF46_9BILA|nr:unnamed protein product [Rotaria sordida]CAF3822769.1 unnamed protein product [Rotaria sordida]
MAYNHGEQSLTNTIGDLPQNFLGSNNTHFLLPSSQFGTSLYGDNDEASAHYSFTQLKLKEIKFFDK